MFCFGTRKITKIGGSFMIALPMQWMKATGANLKKVTIEMDAENALRITPATESAKIEVTGATSHHQEEASNDICIAGKK